MRLLSSSTKPEVMLQTSTFAANSYCPLHLSGFYFSHGVNTGIPAPHKRQPETGLDRRTRVVNSPEELQKC